MKNNRLRIFYWEEHQRRSWFLVGLGLHLLAAWFSSGFLHSDEHWQIIVPLDNKLRGLGLEGLTWEFADSARIRSWFQVALYYPLAKILHVLEASPFFIAFVLRLISCLFAFFSFAWLGAKLLEFENSQRKLFWCQLLALTWFLPLLQVRPRSEGISSAFMFLAIGLLCQACRKREVFFAGLAAGMSFLVRYQMGVVAFSLFLWMLLIDRAKLSLCAWYCLGVLLCLPLGVAADYWGYGAWTFCAYNYFYHNIVLDVASRWGVMPWYFYFTESLKKGVAPVSFLLWGAFFWFIWRKPRHILVAAAVPFLLVHFVVGHKELRFINFGCLLSVWMAVCWYRPWEWRRWKRWLGMALLVINTMALLVMTFRSAKSSIPFHKWMYQNYTNEKIFTVEKKSSLVIDFYLRPELEFVMLGSLADAKGNLLIDNYQQFKELSQRDDCRLEKSHYPIYLLQDRYNYFGWLNRANLLTLWKCQ